MEVPIPRISFNLVNKTTDSQNSFKRMTMSKTKPTITEDLVPIKFEIISIFVLHHSEIEENAKVHLDKWAYQLIIQLSLRMANISFNPASLFKVACENCKRNLDNCVCANTQKK